MNGIVSKLKNRSKSKNQNKHDLECGELLVCDECGFKGKTKEYWGYYGTHFCCPVCLQKHMKKEMER